MSAKVIPLHPERMAVRDLVDVRRRSTALGFVVPVWFTAEAYAAVGRDQITDALWAVFFTAAGLRDTDRALVHVEAMQQEGTDLLLRFEYDANAEQMLVVMLPEEV